MMEDNGPTENFITHALAEKLDLARTSATVLNTLIAGKCKHQDTYKYLLEVVDAQGVSHPVKAFGINSITSIKPVKRVAALERLFPSAPEPRRQHSEGPSEISP